MLRNPFSDTHEPVDRSASSTPQAGNWTKTRFKIAEQEKQKEMEDVPMEDVPIEHLSIEDTKKRKRDISPLPGRDGVQGSKERTHTKAQLTEKMRETTKEDDNTREKEDQQYAWNRFENKYKYYRIIHNYNEEDALDTAFNQLDKNDQDLVKKYRARRQSAQQSEGHESF